jgi:hypothetical protein
VEDLQKADDTRLRLNVFAWRVTDYKLRLPLRKFAARLQHTHVWVHHNLRGRERSFNFYGHLGLIRAVRAKRDLG